MEMGWVRGRAISLSNIERASKPCVQGHTTNGPFQERRKEGSIKVSTRRTASATGPAGSASARKDGVGEGWGGYL